MQKTRLLALWQIFLIVSIFFPSSLAVSFSSRSISYGYSNFYDVATDGTYLFIANQLDIIVYRMETPSFPIYLGAIPNISGNFTAVLTTENYVIAYDQAMHQLYVVSKPTTFTDLEEFQVNRVLELELMSFQGMLVHNNSLVVYGSTLIVYSLTNFGIVYSNDSADIYEMLSFNSTSLVATTPNGLGIFNFNSLSFSIVWDFFIMPAAKMLVETTNVHLYQNNTHSIYRFLTHNSSTLSTGIPVIAMFILHQNAVFAITERPIYLLDESLDLGTVVATRILGKQITGYVTFGETLILSLGLSGMAIVQMDSFGFWSIITERDLPSNNFRHVGTIEIQNTHYAFAVSEWDSIVYFPLDSDTISLTNEMLGQIAFQKSIPWRAEVLSVGSIGNSIIISNSSALSIIQIFPNGSQFLTTHTSDIFGWGISIKGSLFSITNGTHVMLVQYSSGQPFLSIVNSISVPNASDTFFTGSAIYFANRTTIGRIQMQGTQLLQPQQLGVPQTLDTVADIYATDDIILLTGNGALLESYPLSQPESPQIFSAMGNGTKILPIPENGILVAGEDQILAFSGQSYPLQNPFVFYESLTMYDITILENVHLFLGSAGTRGLVLFNFSTEDFPDFSLFFALLFLSIPILIILIIVFTLWKRYARKRKASSPDLQVLDDYFRN